MEYREAVGSFIARLERTHEGHLGEASKGLNRRNSHFSHSRVVDSFQVHGDLVDYASDEGWSTLEKQRSLLRAAKAKCSSSNQIFKNCIGL